MDEHSQTVASVASRVRDFHAQKQAYRIFHGSTNSTRPSNADDQRYIDITSLNHVLEVNATTRTALVEPNVPMDKLVEATLKHGLVPPVVMEFPGITAGGGYAGTSGESSSFRHGFFDRTINFVEMVLADGDVVRASESEHPDLFHGAAGAVGSLGITTMIELRLVEAKAFVKVTYRRTESVAESISILCEESANPETSVYDYLDGIQFSSTHGVVITGQMTDDKPESARIQTFSHPFDPWYYLHVQERTRVPGSAVTEFVPLAEYLFRYDRGGFWVGASAFRYFGAVPFNRLTRWFLDDFLHTRMLYKALHASGESSRYVVQDLALPYENAETFIEYTTQTFGIWPLWLCPLKQPPTPTMHPHNTTTAATGRMLNIGLWGFGPAQQKTFVAKNRDLEAKLRELGGMKWLYAHTYYPEDDFWQVYDRRWYEGLRRKYSATLLPSVYQKVKVVLRDSNSWSAWFVSLWPLGGFWGIWRAIQSKEYYKHRNALWRWRWR
jgi:FAD/FMN-containing dehydrogenase